MGTRMVYRIVVRAELSERYAPAFEGMEMEVKNGLRDLTGRSKTSRTSTESSTA
jgi:hypothetical protein